MFLNSIITLPSFSNAVIKTLVKNHFQILKKCIFCVILNDKEYTVRKLRHFLSKVSSMAWRNLEFPKSFQKFAEILKKFDFEK